MIRNKYDVIVAPLYTEKATIQSEQSKYMFKVHKKADKTLIRKAFEEIFGKKVVSVNIVDNRPGKVKVFKGIKGQRQEMKVALITLQKGEVLDLVGGK